LAVRLLGSARYTARAGVKHRLGLIINAAAGVMVPEPDTRCGHFWELAMNPEKVVFGFFILLALTLNFGFFVGEID
jgi:hypothetical protein